MSEKRIVERIVRKAGVPDIVEILSERLGATDLQSLLLEVYRRRAESGSVRGLLERYAKSRFARPSSAAPSDFIELDRLALSLLPEGFEALELSPVAPFGTTAVVTGTSQNRIVSTIRNTEVASDPTNALALECALRRKSLLADDSRSATKVLLAASQRLVRAQSLPDLPGHMAHFRLFGLCSAGRDSGSFSFELESLPLHVGFYLRLLEARRERGSEIGAIRVPITPLADGPSEEVLRDRVLDPLAEAHPETRFFIDRERAQGRGYYAGVCFHVCAENRAGSDVQLADGGFTDWTQQLVGSRKERLLISGIGSERVVSSF
jgi:hypothetical protein